MSPVTVVLLYLTSFYCTYVRTTNSVKLP